MSFTDVLSWFLYVMAGIALVAIAISLMLLCAACILALWEGIRQVTKVSQKNDKGQVQDDTLQAPVRSAEVLDPTGDQWWSPPDGAQNGQN